MQSMAIQGFGSELTMGPKNWDTFIHKFQKASVRCTIVRTKPRDVRYCTVWNNVDILEQPETPEK